MVAMETQNQDRISNSREKSLCKNPSVAVGEKQGDPEDLDGAMGAGRLRQQ